jgi:hypothetical protein
MTIAAVKAFLGFAHQVGYTRFNAAPLIKLRKAPRQLAQRILSEFDRGLHPHNGFRGSVLAITVSGRVR